MSLRYQSITEEDLPVVKEIYDYYILHSTAIYVNQKISIDDLRTFVPIGDPLYHSYLVFDEENTVVGLCYYGKYKPREGYLRSVEITVYLMPGFTGRGYGSQIISFLENIIREKSFKNIMSQITADNEPSIKLFEKNGYIECGHIRNVAEKFGKVLDLKLYQKEIK